MRKAMFACCVMLLATAIYFAVRDRMALARLRAENADLWKQAAEWRSMDDERVDLLRKQNEEMERLRAGQLELVRLRGEATRLRQQLKLAETASNSPARPGVKSPLPVVQTNARPPVEEFSAIVRAQVGW